MANKNRGEVEFAVDGQAYTLRLGTNEMCSLEAIFEADIQAVFNKLDSKSPRLSDMRLILAAMMRENDLEKVGSVIDELGFDKVGNLLTQAIELAFPEAKTDGGKPKATAK